ncbi:MAG: hypothetical protein LBQ15_10680 [Clostridium sp.]|nr:hypothetical protein [Clostridium sp.]
MRPNAAGAVKCSVLRNAFHPDQLLPIRFSQKERLPPWGGSESRLTGKDRRVYHNDV